MNQPELSPEHTKPLPVDPGHVRTLAHYTAMLDELKAEQEKKKPACGPAFQNTISLTED